MSMQVNENLFKRNRFKRFSNWLMQTFDEKTISFFCPLSNYQNEMVTENSESSEMITIISLFPRFGKEKTLQMKKRNLE